MYSKILFKKNKRSKIIKYKYALNFRVVIYVDSRGIFYNLLEKTPLVEEFNS